MRLSAFGVGLPAGEDFEVDADVGAAAGLGGFGDSFLAMS